MDVGRDFSLRFSLIPSGCWIVEENSQKWRNSPAPHGFHGFLGRPPVKAKKLLLQCPLSPPRSLFFLLKVKVFLFSSRSLTERNPFTSPWLGGEELKTSRPGEGLRKSEQQLQLWLRALQKDFCQTNCQARPLISSSSLLSSRILPRCHLILVNPYQNWLIVTTINSYVLILVTITI